MVFFIVLSVACGVVLAQVDESSGATGYPQELVMLEIDESEIREHEPNNSLEVYVASFSGMDELVEHFTKNLF